MFPIFAGNSASTGYNLTRSLRFRASASAYLNRTPASASNRQIFTFSIWVKIGSIVGASSYLISANTASGYNDGFGISFASGTLDLSATSGGSTIADLNTTQVFRDPSSWYHIVYAVDTTQATAANRIKLYINGAQVTAFGTATYPAQNTNFQMNNTVPTYIGRLGYTSSVMLDGYLAEFNFIDGQALTPSSFGSTNATTGVWQPARYTGTYGTNGFYLPFTDNSALTTSSNVGLGKDFSGNGNYWTTNNISITAGVTYDSMTDVPTLTSATAANFAVVNPNGGAVTGVTETISNGNLNVVLSAPSSNIIAAPATIGITSGSYYWEVTVVSTNSTYSFATAIGISTYAGNDNGTSFTNNCYFYCSKTGLLITNGSTSAYGASFTNGDVIGVAFNATTGTLTFYKNNTSQGAITGVTASTWFPKVGSNDGCTVAINFGQQPFTYTPPTGYVALNTYNLPTSTIVKGNTVMDATLYTGNSSTQTVTNAGAFKPDLVWIKNRSTASQHVLTDSVRGVTKQLFSSLTNAEQTSATGITSLNSNGFSLDTNVSPTGSTNSSPDSYVGWQWQAGQGSTSSNTNGTITSTVSVNASAGFSIVTYTGNGTNGATVGHGLGVKPSLIIEKGRASTYNWPVQGCGVLWPTATQTLFLNNTSGLNAGSGVAAPTSSVFTPAATAYANESGLGYVAYCWTPIAGYSAFGSYTGNGSTDGPMVYAGFQPKFVMTKRTDSTGDWLMWDAARDPYNVVGNALYADLSNAEATGNSAFDFLSNGFKVRNSFANINASGGTYIYMAFATNPFRNSLAR